MNDPKLREQAEHIIQSGGFSTRNLIKSNVGFRNTVWIGQDAVLKIFGDNNREGCALETWFYQTAHPDFAPALYASGDNWILLERIHGTGLYRLWRDMCDEDRIHTVKRIAEIAGAINKIPLEHTEKFLPQPQDYRYTLLTEIHQLAEKLVAKDAIDPALCKAAVAYAEENSFVFQNTECCLVYYDMHFDNLLVTGNGKLILLDYEIMNVAPKDLVLDVWQRMLIHPFTYANEEDHPLTHPRDYRHLMKWMQEADPSLFLHPEIRKRVNLYGIRYEFDILCDYPRAAWPCERLEKYLSEDLW